jgi:histidinol-phosphatase (PHP family)
MGNHTTPTKEILELYRRLGGELITVGSDAHHARHVGSGLDWAYDTLRSLGYRYITTFDQRKPTFIKL